LYDLLLDMADNYANLGLIQIRVHIWWIIWWSRKCWIMLV